MLFTFQFTSDNNRRTDITHLSNDTDNLHEDDTLSPADLMTFAWQIAKGMVRACCMHTAANMISVCNMGINALLAFFTDYCFPFH